MNGSSCVGRDRQPPSKTAVAIAIPNADERRIERLLTQRIENREVSDDLRREAQRRRKEKGGEE